MPREGIYTHQKTVGKPIGHNETGVGHHRHPIREIIDGKRIGTTRIVSVVDKGHFIVLDFTTHEDGDQGEVEADVTNQEPSPLAASSSLAKEKS